MKRGKKVNILCFLFRKVFSLLLFHSLETKTSFFYLKGFLIRFVQLEIVEKKGKKEGKKTSKLNFLGGERAYGIGMFVRPSQNG